MATDKEGLYGDAVAKVCDAATFAALALRRCGVEPTAEAVAMMACEIARQSRK